jgi:hypothetical protein
MKGIKERKGGVKDGSRKNYFSLNFNMPSH